MWLNKLRVLLNHVQLKPGSLAKPLENFSTTARMLDLPTDPFQFSKQDEDVILKTINNSKANELKIYDIREAQLKKLLAYRDKNGNFQSFNDALMAQDVTLFIKFCKSILDGGKKTSVSLQKSSNTVSTPRNLIVPPVCESYSTIKRILGLHIWGNALSWALLVDDNQITEWDYVNFGITPKMSVLSVVDTVAPAILQLPSADAYVMESDGYAALGKMKPSAYQFHLMRQQLMTIIISMMKMRSPEAKDTKEKLTVMNNFYMTQARLSSKVFKLNVGTETVSAERVITELISHQRIASLPQINQISIDPELIEQYKSHEFAIREQLNSALLLTLTFYNHIRTH